METPYFASICARERILRTRTKFCETVKNPGNPQWNGIVLLSVKLLVVLNYANSCSLVSFKKKVVVGLLQRHCFS